MARKPTIDDFASGLWRRSFDPVNLDPEETLPLRTVPLIAGVLEADSLAWLIGPPASGKSFLALDLAAAITGKRPWRGHDVSTDPEAGGVLYLAGEGVPGLSARVVAAGIAGGVTVLPDPPTINAPEWEGLGQMAIEAGADLIVVDTQSRIGVGLDENSARDMSVLVEALEGLRRVSGACVLVIHHTGRSGAIRGSTVLEAAASTILRTTKTGDKVTVSCVKRRDGAPFDDIRLRLVAAGESARLVDDEPVDVPAAIQPAAGTGLSSTVEAALRAWWDAHQDAEITGTELGRVIPSSTFHRHKAGLLAAGWVASTGSGSSRRWRLARHP